jgi:predicted amidohydrolase
MTGRFRLACVQTSTTNQMAANIAAVCQLIREARERGADLIALPEVVAMMEPDRRLVYAKAFAEPDHPALGAFRDLARETGAWILGGSITVRTGPGKVANRSLLLDPEGEVVGRYDKIHMFDVDLPGGESYRESDAYEPGRATCVARTPWGGLGMTICYDLRFPALYRDLALAGADFLSVPSAFTRPTGAAHWSVLLRARAIETGCFVFAPAQCGEHAGGRKTYGHSMIVDPWGAVLAEADEEVGVIVADIDPARIAEVRASVPSLRHIRSYALPSSRRAAE